MFTRLKLLIHLIIILIFLSGCGFSGNESNFGSSSSSSSSSSTTTTPDLTLTLITSWGSVGTNSGQFANPQYTYVYNSKLYVADKQLSDFNNKKVAVYDLNGNLDSEISFSGSVSNLCIYNNRLYVISGGVVNINISNTSDNYTINLQNSSGSSISGSHCAVNSTNIFILSDSTFKVYKFSLSNFQNTTTDNATTSWGSGGSGSGQYMGYGSIIADENYVYISSRDGSGITKFDTSGNVIKHNGSPKIRQIYFNPSNSSEIFAWDFNAGKFKIYDTSLIELKTNAGTSSSGIPGGDHGLSADSSGYVYISGYHNDYKISKYLLTRN